MQLCVCVCVKVNYRGSTGFGKSFLHAGDAEWGVGAMQNDLTDSVEWAVQQGIADPKRVAIFGGSYGQCLYHCCITYNRCSMLCKAGALQGSECVHAQP